jgi:hypothetical protein
MADPCAHGWGQVCGCLSTVSGLEQEGAFALFAFRQSAVLGMSLPQKALLFGLVGVLVEPLDLFVLLLVFLLIDPLIQVQCTAAPNGQLL